MRLSIVVPACNEEKRIGPMLDSYVPFFESRYGDAVEFVVVVNGSTDRTAELVRAYGDGHPAVRCVEEPGRIGKGGALIRGFKEARGELVGFCDADGATPPSAFHALVESLGTAGCVIASRWRPDSVVSPRQPFVRRITSRVFNLVTRLLFGLRFTDTQCGAKLMRGEALRAVVPHLGITQWAFDVDLLLQLRRAGYLIREIPTTWHDVVGSKVEVARASSEMLAALLRLRLLYSRLGWVVGLYDRLLGPLIHPAQMEEDRLFRHSLLLMVGSNVSNVMNALFQFAMAAMLTHADYGVLAAMLALISYLGAPLGALGQAVSHRTATYLQEGRVGAVKGLLRRQGRFLSVPILLLLLAACFGGVQAVADFNRMTGTLPVVVATMTILVCVYAVLPGGALSGAQAFLWITGLGGVGSAVKLAVALVLVAAGGGVVGALFGVVAGTVLSTAGSVYAVRQVLGTQPASGSGDGIALYGYASKYIVALVGYSVLMIGDATIVKHFFTAEEAGVFAKAAMLARSVVFLPSPIATALFPKVVSSGAPGRGHGRVLVKALLFTVLMTAAGALVCSAAPGFWLRILTRTTNPEAAHILRVMVWALLPVSLLQVLMSFELAQRRFAVNWVLVGCAALYVGLAWRWHADPMQIVAILGLCGLLALALQIALLPWRSFRRTANGAQRPDSP